MATKLNRWSDTLRKSKLPRSRIERIHREADAELIEMNMRELREAAGKTQAQAAAAAKMSQSDLSKAERRPDHRVSFLRRYVKALGGEFEAVAVVNGKRIRLHGV